MEGYAEARTKFDLTALPAHFALELPIPPDFKPYPQLLSEVRSALGLTTEYPLLLLYWSTTFNKFDVVPPGLLDSILENIFSHVLANTHCDAAGHVRGSCYLMIRLDYTVYKE